jgi:hypothetical protein
MAASAPTHQGVAPPWHAGPAHVTPFFVVSGETPGGLVVGASPEGGGTVRATMVAEHRHCARWQISADGGGGAQC